MLVELGDLAVEVADPAGNATQRDAGGVGWVLDPVAVGSQLQAKPGPGAQRASLSELAAELLGRGDQQVVELVQRGGARLQGAGSSDAQLPDRLDDPGRLLRHRGRSAAQRGAGREFGVDRVALAEPLSGVRVRLIDLDDPDRVGDQYPHQPGRIGAGRLDPDPVDLALPAQPGD